MGQKVVCINDKVSPQVRALYDHWIKEGTVYVVREVFLGAAPGKGNDFTEVAVTLLGVTNPTPKVPGARERGFNSERFRPIEEKPVVQRKEEEIPAKVRLSHQWLTEGAHAQELPPRLAAFS